MRQKGHVQKLNETRTEDIVYAYTYVKRENAKVKNIERRSDRQLRKHVADMLRVSLTSVSSTLQSKYIFININFVY